MDNPFAEMLTDLANEIREKAKQEVRPVNQVFHTQDEAFTYYRRLAALKPGDTVNYQTTHGKKCGIFMKMTDHCMPIVFGWEDGKHTGTAISPTCVILEDETYDVDDDDIQEFPRT